MEKCEVILTCQVPFLIVMDFPHQAPAEHEPEFSVNTYNKDHGGKGIPMKLL